MRTYLIKYTYNGKTYGAEIQAESCQDAEDRMRSIGKTGSVDGELVMAYDINNNN